MRIHSNTLKASDFHAIVADLPGVSVEVSTHGSRIAARAFEVKLEGNSTARNMSNTGYAATWDEWGVFLANVFYLDGQALCGSAKYAVYRDEEHFHAVTRYRFEGLDMPEDTHPRHKWVWGVGITQCTKCSAEMERGI